MKRLHIHVGVENIEEATRFYSALFGAQPVKTKADYAKWLLDDPRVNFAVSTRANKKGVDHLGIQHFRVFLCVTNYHRIQLFQNAVSLI